MKIFDGFHPSHYEALRMAKLGYPMSSDISFEVAPKIYAFKNGYGASVIQGSMSFNYPELAVIFFENPIGIRSKKKRHLKKALKKAGHYSLTYDTPISDDVKRYEDLNELQRDLNRIARLKAGR